MVLTNEQAAQVALDYVLDRIQTFDDEYGDIAEVTAENHPRAVDEDYELVAEYITDWRIRLQRLIKEMGVK